MNKAIVLQSINISGAEKRFFRLSKELNKMSKDVYLIIDEQLLKKAQADSELVLIIEYLRDNDKLRILPHNLKTPKVIQYFLELFHLKKIIAKDNLKLIHLVLRSRRLSLVKMLVDIKCISEITSPDIAKSLTSLKHRLLLKYNDLFIAVSPSVRKKTEESMAFLKIDNYDKKIVTMPIPFFLPNRNIHLSIKDKDNLIVFASRFIERKNPILFAKAVRKFLLVADDSWKVAILGSGKLEEKLRSILKENIENDQVYVGYSNNIYDYLEKSKIFVSLIYPDNYPSQSILEALYSNNALLATDIGSTREFFNNNGLLVENFEVQEVFEKLLSLTNDQNLPNLMRNSSELITEKFSKELYLKHLNEIYGSVLDK